MPFPFPFTLFGESRASAATTTCDFTYCYGGDWVQGKVGNYALDFDGGTNFVLIDTTPTLNAQDALTLACWVNEDGYQSTHGNIFMSKWNWTDGNRAWYFRSVAGLPEFAATELGSWAGGSVIRKATTTLSTDTWHHLAATYDRNASECFFYVDGVREDGAITGTPDFQISEEDGIAMQLGAYDYPKFDTYYLNGTLDECAIWNVALTADQINTLSTSSVRADSITPPNESDGAWVTGTTGSAAVGNITSSYALEFEGAGGYNNVVEADSCASSFDGLATWSFATWYWTDFLPDAAEDASLFALESDAGTDGCLRISLRGHSAGYLWRGLVLNMAGGSGGGAVGLGSHYAWVGRTDIYPVSKPAPTGQWNHVAIAYDGSQTTSPEIVQIWINGIKFYMDNSNGEWPAATPGAVSTPAYLYDTIYSGFDYAKIGDSNSTEGSQLGNFDGKLDQMATWDVRLTNTDVLNLFSGTLAPSALSASDLISYWSMDDDGPTSTNLSDSSGNGFDGTLTNMDAGTTGSLLLYYDFEIGDSNPVSGNFPMANEYGQSFIYDVVTASFHGATAYTGTMTSMTQASFGDWSQGYKGKYSLGFDEDTVSPAAGVVIADNAKIQFGEGDDFSVTCWVKSKDMMAGASGYVSKMVSGGGWTLGRWSDDKFVFQIRDGSYENAISNSDWMDTNWTHLAGVRINNTASLWVNGVVQTTTTNNDINDSGNDLIIGRWYQDSTSYHADAYLDEVGIWNVGLDSGSILNLYSGSLCSAVSSSNLVAYYDMECDGPGSSNLKDMSGNDLSGTLTNMNNGTCGAG